MTKKSGFIALMGILLVLGACKNASFKKTPGGMPYKVYSKGDGPKIDTNDIIKIHYSRTYNDSLMFSSFGELPIYYQVTDFKSPYDITEIFFELKEGDSVITVQSVDTFIARDPRSVPPNWKKGDRLETVMKVLKVFKTRELAMADEESEKKAFLETEIKEVTEYLSKNNINATRTKSGAFVEIIEPGTGQEVDSGNYVMILYKGQTLKGTIFDTNMDSSFGHPGAFPFIAGAGMQPGGSIVGFDEGIQMLRKGSRARIYVPSLLGYGGQPPPGTTLIQPFEHLIFEVQIEEVYDEPPATSVMPQLDPHGSHGSEK